MKRSRVVFFVLFVVLMVVFVSTEVKADTTTVYEYSIGGGGSSDDTSGSGSSTFAYDCTEANSCPRWFLMSQQQFKQLINGGEDNFAYGSAAYGDIKNVCQNNNDRYVMVAANFKLQNYYPIGYNLDSVRIFNFTDKSVSPPKSEHVYTSVVNDDGSVETKIDWTDGVDPATKGFFSWKIEGKDMTYGQLLKEITSKYGIDETQLAVACMSMYEGAPAPDPEPEPEPTKVTLTGVAIDTNGKYLGVPNVTSTVTKGSSASITRREITDYEFKGWKDSKTATSYSKTSTTYSVSSLNSSKTVYAVYEKNVQSYYTKTSVGITYSDKTKKDGTTGIMKTRDNFSSGFILNFGGKVLTVGDSVSMIFSQQAYSDLNENSVSWGINRIRMDSRQPTAQMFATAPKTFEDSSGAYSITETKSTSNSLNLSDSSQFTTTNGSADFGVSRGANAVPKLIAKEGSRLFTDDGKNRYIHRDVYSLTFKKAGYYKFCEQFNIHSEFGTIGCAYFEVKEPELNPEPTPTPDTEEYTLTGIHVDTDGNRISGVNETSSGYVKKGSKASVNRKKSIDGYEFVGWMKCRYNDMDSDCRKNLNDSSKYITTRISTNSYYISGDNDVTFNVKTLGTPTTVYAVYKKAFSKVPSIQIWGGSMYTNGNVNVPLEKKNIDGKEKIFGSWVEHGILRGGGTLGGILDVNGMLGGVGSGASMGYSGDTRLAGGKEVCSSGKLISCISPLTIPNEVDGDKLKGSSAKVKPSFSDRKELVEIGLNVYESHSYNDNRALVLDVNDGSIISEDADKIYVKSGTNIFKFNNRFTINKNIVYSDEGYDSTYNIPKLIIYAENIDISCSVSRIDAVLIAEGEINTCSDVSDINSAGRSNQLKINGSIITNKLIAGRTYGAGTGIYSVIPAEIIDYDSSLYLWSAAGKKDISSFEPDELNGNNLTTTSLRELPPRL